VQNDPKYSKSVLDYSNGEVLGIKIINYNEFLAIPSDQFTYLHEYEAIAKFLSKYK